MKVNFDADRVGLLLGIVKEAAQHGQMLQPVVDAANAELVEINDDIAEQLAEARDARDKEIAEDNAQRQHELQLAAEEDARAKGLPAPEIKSGPAQVDASVTTFPQPAPVAVPGVPVVEAPEPTPVTPAIPPPGSAAGDTPIAPPQPHEEVPEGGSAPAPSLAPPPAKEGITDPGPAQPSPAQTPISAAGDVPKQPSPIGPGSSTPQSPVATETAAASPTPSPEPIPAADPPAPRRI